MAITRGTLSTGTAASPAVTSPITASSLVNSGKATAPTAGTNIVTLAAPAAGLYNIEVWLSASGTATTAAADSNNMNLLAGATTVATFLPFNCSTAGNVTNGGPFMIQRSLDGSTNLTVNAVGNATAGTVYAAMIVATKVA
jgi:hypothetical protein